jgi:hypothetical protein
MIFLESSPLSITGICSAARTCAPGNSSRSFSPSHLKSGRERFTIELLGVDFKVNTR